MTNTIKNDPLFIINWLSFNIDPTNEELKIEKNIAVKIALDFHTNKKDDNTTMQRAWLKAKQKIYANTRKEKKKSLSDTQEGDTHWEKILRGFLRKSYRKHLLENILVKYNIKSMLDTIFTKINNHTIRNNDKRSNALHQINYDKFIRKNTSFMKNAMNYHRVKFHDFKQTRACIDFMYRHSNGFFHNKCEHE